MEELIETLETCTNIKTISYDTETKLCTIIYKSEDFIPDEVPSEMLIDHLNNA